MRAELTNLYAKLRNEQFKPLFEDNEAVIKHLKNQIAEKQQVYETLLISLKASNPEYAALLSVDPLELADLQQLLDDQTTLLVYAVAPAQTTVFVISRATLEAVNVPVSEKNLYLAIRETRQTVDADDPASASWRQLYDWLIAPVHPLLKTPIVGIVPDGVLHYLSFAALQEPTLQYFGDQFLLFSLPNASTFKFIQVKRKAEAGPALVMGYKGYEPPLQFAEQEALHVADLRHAQVLVGEQATKEAFRQFAQNSAVIHLSAHALLNAQSPFFSGILLYDGQLTVQDVFAMPLPKLDLAVLSACNTQLGETFEQHHTGREIVALNRAFIYAGAPSVVASLWNVNDQATYDFMVAFHTALTHGLNKAEAVQQAQIETRRKYPQPRYWAAFALTGDWERAVDIQSAHAEQEPTAVAPRIEPTAIPTNDRSLGSDNREIAVTPTPVPETRRNQASNQMSLLLGIGLAAGLLAVLGAGGWFVLKRGK